MRLCIFEDEKYRNLYPLILLRPVYDLRCGILTLREKIRRVFPDLDLVLHCRQYLSELVQEENPGIPVNRISGDSCLFVNGRLLPDPDFAHRIDLSWEGVYRKGDEVVCAVVKENRLTAIAPHLGDPLSLRCFEGLPVREIQAKLIEYPWHFIEKNASQIEQDFKALAGRGEIRGRIYENVSLLDRENIFIDEGAKVKPGVVIDAEGGPVYIGKNVKILPNATIEGPAFIGEGSSIKVGAKIYEGTSIGEVCKVGGEVEESIIHSYSNKQHDGFLGHSYLGQWVNIGADTNNSDLKNNYSTVKVYVNGEMIDSGSLFVGLTMGDHSKSGINTMFNTGTIVGIMSNVYGGGFPPKFIPSFAWGGAEGFVEHDLEKALETARRVMARRDRELTPALEKVIRQAFELTKSERNFKK